MTTGRASRRGKTVVEPILREAASAEADGTHIVVARCLVDDVHTVTTTMATSIRATSDVTQAEAAKAAELAEDTRVPKCSHGARTHA